MGVTVRRSRTVRGRHAAAYRLGMDNPDRGARRTRPYVVVHVAVSLDGSTGGFQPDVGRFYELAGTWREDVTLAGADTILAQEEALAEAELPGPATDGPALAVVDGRGRVGAWQALHDAGYWSGVVAVHCDATPPRSHGFPEVVAGTDRVDLPELMVTLRERPWHGGGPRSGNALTLVSAETRPDGLVWLRHRTAGEAP